MPEISDKTRVRLLGGGLAEKLPAAWTPNPSPQAALVAGRRAGCGSAALSEFCDRVPARAAAAPAAAIGTAGPIFLSDSADGADMLDAANVVQPLAQLCVTPQAQTPILAAVAGPGGAGKSFALKRLAQTIEALAGSSGALARVVVARVDATKGAEAPVALASAAYAALDREPGGRRLFGAARRIRRMPEATLCGRRMPPPTGMTKSCASSKPSARSATSSKREARASPMRWFTKRPARASTSSCVRGAARSTSRLRRFELAGSDAALSYRDLVRDMASMGAAGRAGWRCGRCGPIAASDAFSSGRSSPSSSASSSICCAERRC